MLRCGCSRGPRLARRCNPNRCMQSNQYDSRDSSINLLLCSYHCGLPVAFVWDWSVWEANVTPRKLFRGWPTTRDCPCSSISKFRKSGCKERGLTAVHQNVANCLPSVKPDLFPWEGVGGLRISFYWWKNNADLVSPPKRWLERHQSSLRLLQGPQAQITRALYIDFATSTFFHNVFHRDSASISRSILSKSAQPRTTCLEPAVFGGKSALIKMLSMPMFPWILVFIMTPVIGVFHERWLLTNERAKQTNHLINWEFFISMSVWRQCILARDTSGITWLPLITHIEFQIAMR